MEEAAGSRPRTPSKKRAGQGTLEGQGDVAHMCGEVVAEHDDPTRNVTYNATLRQHGIFKSPAKLYPSLAITSKDLDQTKAAVEHAVRSISLA